MTHSPTGTRTLTRSRDDRVIAGVCGGVARYLNLDPSLVRIAVAVLSLFTGVGVVVYLVAALVIPEDGAAHSLWQQNNPFGSRPSTTPATDPTSPTGPVYRDQRGQAPHNPDDLR